MTPATPDPGCPSTRRHGTRQAYGGDRCRCPTACAAAARYRKERRIAKQHGQRQMVDATGTRRRLRALMAIGWSAAALAERMGYAHYRSVQLATTRSVVRRATADHVAAVYEQLSDTPGPSPTAAGMAAAYGYPPPIAWDDDTIVDPAARPWAELAADGPDWAVVIRLLDGGPRPAVVRPADRAAFVDAALSAGWDRPRVAARLGCSTRQVERIHAAPPPAPPDPGDNERLCEGCGTARRRPAGDPPWQFRKRRYCDSCHQAARAEAGRRGAATRWEKAS